MATTRAAITTGHCGKDRRCCAGHYGKAGEAPEGGAGAGSAAVAVTTASAPRRGRAGAGRVPAGPAAHAAESAALRPAAGCPLGECPARGTRRAQPGLGGPAGWKRSRGLPFRRRFPRRFTSLGRRPPPVLPARWFYWETDMSSIAERESSSV